MCARTGLWDPWGGNAPGPPGQRGLDRTTAPAASQMSRDPATETGIDAWHMFYSTCDIAVTPISSKRIRTRQNWSQLNAAAPSEGQSSSSIATPHPCPISLRSGPSRLSRPVRLPPKRRHHQIAVDICQTTIRQSVAVVWMTPVELGNIPPFRQVDVEAARSVG